MNIDELEAGPELDILIAEKVMGRKVGYLGGGRSVPRIVGEAANGDPRITYDVPSYSTGIAAAWEVVQLLKDRFNWIEHADHGYAACFAKTNKFAVMAYGDTAPLAICRAALKAIEE